ncbi:XRE family transcriptional regulator [Mesorhizobium tianshanense]|uniref:XRE family transcriptional regulator n=1 Tax=Mesorhizobium tianshanense TaxID=39844 RepID=UPI0011A271A7|nr:XRE family transcriptional regulator [Mesorhizobium tianshanense]
MSYDDFIAELDKAHLSVREFAQLLGRRPNSISNNRKLGEVPDHLAVIAALLAELQIRDIPFRPVLKRLGLSPKRPRGAAAVGKFGGEKQGRLELGT